MKLTLATAFLIFASSTSWADTALPTTPQQDLACKCAPVVHKPTHRARVVAKSQVTTTPVVQTEVIQQPYPVPYPVYEQTPVQYYAPSYPYPSYYPYAYPYAYPNYYGYRHPRFYGGYNYGPRYYGGGYNRGFGGYHGGYGGYHGGGFGGHGGGRH